MLFALKLAFVLPATHGPTVDDERFYWSYARLLSEGRMYEGTKYPPAYPAAIAPAFHLGDDPYRAALALSALYSSLLAFPVFGIARLVTGRFPAFAVTVAQALLPFHYIVSRTLLSENTFMPLLLGVLFMMLWRPHRRAWAWDIAAGAGMALLYLTRYVSLPLIPALLVVWWMREWQHTGRVRLSAGSWTRFAAMCAAALLAFAPWVLYHVREGVAFPLTLGFGVASRTDPAQLTLGRLTWYVRVYLAYFALLAAPVLGLVTLAVREVWRSRVLDAYSRLVAAVGVVTLFTLVALSRHSWRAIYNYPDPTKIMGRYTLYLTVLFAIVAFATLVRMIERPSGCAPSSGVVAAYGLGVPAIVLGASYTTVLGDWVIPFSPGQITDRGSVDVYRIILMGPWFAVAVAVLLAGTAVLLVQARGRSTTAPVALLLAGLLGYQLFAIPAYLEQMWRLQTGAVHVVESLRLVEEYLPGTPVFIAITPEVAASQGMAKATVKFTADAFRDGRDIKVLVGNDLVSSPAATGRKTAGPEAESEDRDRVRLKVRLASKLDSDEWVLGTWAIRDVEYALVTR